MAHDRRLNLIGKINLTELFGTDIDRQYQVPGMRLKLPAFQL
jgi:hypothetical protein